MKEVFCTSFLRFRKSRLLVVLIAAVVIVMIAATAILIARIGRGAIGSEYNEEFLLMEKEMTEEALKNPYLTESEKKNILLDLSRIEYFLETKTGSGDYYIESSSDGGAYWMQVYFIFGAATAAIAAVILSAWFFPGTKSGIHRTEFLTGRSRASLWLGKNCAAAIMSLAVPLFFSLVTLICAVSAPEVRFLSEDRILFKVYSVSVFTQWAEQVVGLCAIGLAASALVSISTSLSGDSAVGIAVPLMLELLCTLGLFFILNIFHVEGVDNTVWYFVPFLGLIVSSFRDGTVLAYLLSVLTHLVAAAICYGVSYAVFARKPL